MHSSFRCSEKFLGQIWLCGHQKLESFKEMFLMLSSVDHCIVFFFRFIGELFKLKMLTENIMHDCVFKLLRTKDPENLECLCRLLTTIGKELETDKAKVCIGPVKRKN